MKIDTHKVYDLRFSSIFDINRLPVIGKIDDDRFYRLSDFID